MPTLNSKRFILQIKNSCLYLVFFIQNYSQTAAAIEERALQERQQQKARMKRLNLNETSLFIHKLK